MSIRESHFDPHFWCGTLYHMYSMKITSKHNQISHVTAWMTKDLRTETIFHAQSSW